MSPKLSFFLYLLSTHTEPRPRDAVVADCVRKFRVRCIFIEFLPSAILLVRPREPAHVQRTAKFVEPRVVRVRLFDDLRPAQFLRQLPHIPL